MYLNNSNHTIMKKIKTIFRFFGIVLISIILYVIIAFGISHVPVNTAFENCKNSKISAENSTENTAETCVKVFLLTNGVHTDIVLPAKNSTKNWRNSINPTTTKTDNSNAKFVAFGWGDKGFFLETPTWGDLKASTAFNALFYLGSATMHTTFYNESELQENASCKKIFISRENYQKLVNFIESSFKTTENGNYQLIMQGQNPHSYGNDDIFFEAKGAYSLFYTCNTWTNNALKAADMKACLWTLFDKPILAKYDKF